MRYPLALRAFAVCIPLCALVACGKSDGQQGNGPIEVAVTRIEERAVPLTLEAVGRTEGAKEVEIRARVSGIIEKRQYNEGAFVRACAGRPSAS